MESSVVQRALQENLFVLHYQPKIDLATKKVRSIEALIRIQDGDSFIMPNEFISLAEESGDIIEIDRWVFNKVIEDSRYISMLTHEDISITINVSTTNFLQEDFIQNLEDIFDFTTDFVSQFELEFTEYSLIKDKESALEKMKGLKEKGFTISIDDFGTGYSSFAYLKDFPIDCIKIDKSFIDDIEEDSKTSKIIESIIYLAKKLELKTVAEGVEEVTQVEWLYKHQCDEIQGYYYSKPLSMQKLVIFIKAINESSSKGDYIVWNDKYSVGSYAFDTHHMIIASLLNKIYKELRDKEMIQKSEVKSYFSLLDRYIEIHFSAEEQYMNKIGYKNSVVHKRLHDNFKEILKDFQETLTTSNQTNIYRLFKILKDWLVNHELKEDRDIIEKN